MPILGVGCSLEMMFIINWNRFGNGYEGPRGTTVSRFEGSPSFFVCKDTPKKTELPNLYIVLAVNNLSKNSFKCLFLLASSNQTDRKKVITLYIIVKTVYKVVYFLQNKRGQMV